MKEKMISEKVLYQDKLKSAEQNTQERFEPIVSFLKANISKSRFEPENQRQGNICQYTDKIAYFGTATIYINIG